MPGPSKRRGAVRKTTKKPPAGSGGRVKRGLEGKGPTPKAKDRPYHKAHKAAKKAEKGATSSGRPKRRTSGDAEWIAGRNSVVEALREGVPATMLYVQQFIDNDERVREALQLAADRGGIHLMEAPRPELDRMTNGLNHQG
ncbi:MAG TPA: RNA methyltransferase substrate-binding domain-containing protein, partial [Nocardioides sp.]|nr:RNA methyltransferase substrate-binding domain-containing protein [Nocardioides sp.]